MQTEGKKKERRPLKVVTEENLRGKKGPSLETLIQDQVTLLGSFVLYAKIFFTQFISSLLKYSPRVLELLLRYLLSLFVFVSTWISFPCFFIDLLQPILQVISHITYDHI